MSKRFLTVTMAAAMLLSGLSALPAQAATEVPAVAQIEDPVDDANFINDQGQPGVNVLGNPIVVPDSDDNKPPCPPAPAPCDGSTVSDMIKVWFSAEGDKISAHILSQRPGPASTSILYRVFASPGEGEVGSSAVGCVRFELFLAGKEANTNQQTTYRGDSFAVMRDVCNIGSGLSTAVAAEYTIEELEDRTGITTITVPRSSSPLFAEAGLTKPQAETVLFWGGEFPELGKNSVTVPRSDTTKIGTDFTIGDVEPPPPPPPPPVCKKAQKKTCKCPAFVPAEAGADAELTKITEKATAKRPAIVTVSADAGAGVGGVPVVEEGIAHAFENLQVDLKKKKTTGLYVRLEFPDQADYDLTLFNPNGTVAAQSAGFNPAPGH
ncbi:MAG: hypothetical protein M3285_04730, partial [Actinomycetota bacterium]|nr:hypothetical protein [Actinomycetota bacterium]